MKRCASGPLRKKQVGPCGGSASVHDRCLRMLCCSASAPQARRGRLAQMRWTSVLQAKNLQAAGSMWEGCSKRTETRNAGPITDSPSRHCERMMARCRRCLVRRCRPGKNHIHALASKHRWRSVAAAAASRMQRGPQQHRETFLHHVRCLTACIAVAATGFESVVMQACCPQLRRAMEGGPWVALPPRQLLGST